MKNSNKIQHTHIFDSTSFMSHFGKSFQYKHCY